MSLRATRNDFLHYCNLLLQIVCFLLPHITKLLFDQNFFKIYN